MTPTWGIPGPVFLVVWALLALVTMFLPRLALVAWHRGPVAPPDRTLTPEQLGALAGGTDRAVAASIAGLVESGRLRVDDERRICAVVADGRPRPEDDPALSDLDVGVLRRAATPRTGRQLVAEAQPLGAVQELDEQLVARGLLRDPARMRARARRAWIPFGLVVLLGLARLAAGLGHGASVGLLVFALVLVLVVASTVKPRNFRVVTPEGRATLAATRDATRDAARAGTRSAAMASGTPGPAGSVLLGAALLVALGGFAAFPDPGLAALLVPAYTGGGGSDGGSSCGSSCSSSSCGGGGGCGGGGCGG